MNDYINSIKNTPSTFFRTLMANLKVRESEGYSGEGGKTLRDLIATNFGVTVAQFNAFVSPVLDDAACQALSSVKKDNYYQSNNPDVSAEIQKGFTTAMNHWNQFGKNELRINCYP